MKSISTFFLILFFVACQGGDKIVEIKINSLLHDDSSKVWMIESEKVNGVEQVSQNINFRTIITFYNTHDFAEQTLNTMGNKPPKYGTFYIGEKNGTLHFKRNINENVFSIKRYSKKAIELTSSDKKGTKTFIRLVPLPRL